MRTRNTLLLMAGLLVPITASAASAESKMPERFTLGRYIPADSWLFMEFVHNPDAEFIEKHWAKVFEALKKTGLERDLMGLVAMAVEDEEERAKIEGTIDKVVELAKSVNWGDMLAKQMAMGERTTSIQTGGYEFYMLMRGAEGSGEKNYKALSELVGEFASWTEELKLKETDRDGVTVLSTNIDDQVDKMFSAHLFRKDDLIGLVMGNKALGDVLDLMAGKEGAQAVVDSPRFQKALSMVKAPEDGVVFWDGRLFFDKFRKMMKDGIESEAPADSEGAKQTSKIVDNGMELIDVFEFSIATVNTEGRQQFTHDALVLKEEKLDKPFCQTFLKRKPFEKYDRYIPADAKSFSMDGFLDLEGMYDIVLGFIEENIPDGKGMIETWNTKLAEFGFVPKRDLFSWWGGEMITVTMAPAVVTPMGGDDSVMMIRVTDKEKATQKIDTVLNWANTMMQGQGQALMITPADIKTEGFKEITHPMMAMMMVRPVIGVHDEWLMIGSSGAAIQKCLDVAAGEAPSIVTNERFQEEGLKADGPVMSLSFTDTTNFGQELAGGVGMVGMIGGMMTPQIPDPQGRKFLSKIMSMVMKLGPVFQKIDFYSSEASRCVVEGAVIRSDRVVTYKSEEEMNKETKQAANN